MPRVDKNASQMTFNDPTLCHDPNKVRRTRREEGEEEGAKGGRCRLMAW